MTKKSPILVFLLTCITLFIYGIVWYVKSGREMRAKGAEVPTAWLMIIPIISFYWFWKWCAAVGKVTKGGMHGLVAAILIILLGPIGMAIIQSQFNKVS